MRPILTDLTSIPHGKFKDSDDAVVAIAAVELSSFFVEDTNEGIEVDSMGDDDVDEAVDDDSDELVTYEGDDINKNDDDVVSNLSVDESPTPVLLVSNTGVALGPAVSRLSSTVVRSSVSLSVVVVFI